MTWKQSRTKKHYDLFNMWTMRVGAFYLIVSDGGGDHADHPPKHNIYIGVHYHADDCDIATKYLTVPMSRLDQGVERAKLIAEKMGRKAGLRLP